MSEHVRERLTPFLDGELPPPERTAVEAHLESCAECAGLLEDLAAVDALARSLPVPAPAHGFDAFPARVRARISPRPRRRGGLPVWGWAAAAALLLAVVTPLTLRERPSPEPASAPARSVPEAVAPATIPPATLMEADGVRRQDEAGAKQKQEARARAVAAAESAAKVSPPEAVLQRKLDHHAARVGGVSEQVTVAPAHPVVAQGSRGQPPPGYLSPTPAAAPSPPPPPSLETVREEISVVPASPAKPEPVTGDKMAYRRDGSDETKAAATTTTLPAPTSYTLGADLEDQRVGEREAGAAADAPKKVAEGGGRANTTEVAKPKSPPAGFALLGKDSPADDDAYRALVARPTQTVAAAREAREAWRAYVRARPQGLRSDEARVRTIEAGLAAWQLSRDERDRQVLRRDIDEYLNRADALRAERVRTLRRAIEPR